MEGLTILRPVDWLSVWKIYHSLFYWVYIASGVPLRVLMVRRSGAVSTNSAWFASSIVSCVFVLCTPFAAIPAFVLVLLGAGEGAVHSFFMAIPMAASIGAAGALVDGTLFRFLLREKVDGKRFRLMFATNVVNVSIAIGIVIEWLLVYPPQVIAALG